MRLPLKILSCLLGLTLGVEICSAWMEYTERSNFWLYNCFGLVEFGFYGFFFLRLTRHHRWRRALRVFLVFFPAFWIGMVVIVFKLKTWNSYGMIAGSFFTVVFVLYFYYELIVDLEIRRIRFLPEFWIATGLLTFYLPALPFFGTLNFLVLHHLEAARILGTVIIFLDTFMYLLFSYAFLCRIIAKKS